jgi:hypothetical protein
MTKIKMIKTTMTNYVSKKLFRSFENLKFEFVSYFGFRASNF